MQILKDLFTNHMIIIPLIAWASSQVMKIFTYLIVEKKLVWKRVISDGGMPSAHSATVMSLAVTCGWTQGFDSPAFAIAVILAVVIMRDAVGVRRESGVNAEAIKRLADKSNENLGAGEDKIKTDKLKTLVGHTPMQVAFGCVIGIIISLIYILIGNIPLA
jgi:acid phosphatase family membrane protein YuiD